MTFSPTPEQTEICATVSQTKQSLLVEAGAGCGKTSTLKLASPGIKTAALAIAFNKKIQLDLEKALPPNFLAKTMNGLGYGVLARLTSGKGSSGAVKLQLDDRKVGRLASELGPKDSKGKSALEPGEWEDLVKMVKTAQINGLCPSQSGGKGLMEDSGESWDLICEAADLDPDPEMIGLARDILAASIQESLTKGKITFDDQLYIPTCFGGKFPQFETVLVDEDQDLNPIQIEMVSRVLAPRGRLIAVGDKRQAIYAWRGACGDAAQRLKRLRPEGTWVELPLMTTFRCPQVVVERQQAHVPGFRCGPGAPRGQLLEFGPGGRAFGWESLRSAAEGRPIAILCRNNAPLVKLAMKLIRRGIAVQMLGRDLGKNLGKLIQKICPKADTPTPVIISATQQWVDHETTILEAKNQPSRIEGLQDRADCVYALIEFSGAKTQSELLGAIKKVFSGDSEHIILSSVHRAKGLEWPFVVHLDHWRPGRAAAKADKEGNLTAAEQERNIQYVAETRAQQVLALASIADWEAAEGGRGDQ